MKTEVKYIPAAHGKTYSLYAHLIQVSSKHGQLCVPILVQFHIYFLSVLLPECRKWSAAPVSARLHRGPRCCFRSECCIESMAAPRVNRFLAPTTYHRARGWTFCP